MKKLSIATFLCTQAFIFTAFGQTVNQVYAPVPPTLFPALNNNLNSKPSFTGGVGAPTSGCTASKDLYVASNGDFYVCVATDNNWVLQGSGINALTGDVTAGPGSGSQTATLATVNSGPGTCGDSTHVCAITTNGKGLVTAQGAVVIASALLVDVTAAPYNAVCDGTGNQGAAISAAITAVSAAGGGTITAPTGVNCRITTAVVWKSNVWQSGQWTITQATSGLEAIHIQAGSTNISLNGLTLHGAGLFNSDGTTNGLRVSGVTFESNTNTAYPFNVSVFSSLPLTNAVFTGNRFNNVAGGYEIHTVHGLKIDKDVFTNVGTGSLPVDAIYLLNTGANKADSNCSNGITITDVSMTGLTRMGIETQNCYVDPIVIDNPNMSQWSGSAALALAYGISINNLNSLTNSASAIITNPNLTGAGAAATAPQLGIEIASPGVSIRGGSVQNFFRGIQGTTGSGANGLATTQGVTLSGNGAAYDVSADGAGHYLIGNTFTQNSTDIFFEDGTSCRASVVDSTFIKTPATGDSGDNFRILLGSAPTNCPRTFRNLNFHWPTGTIPGGAAYKAFNNSASVPGTIMDGITMQNDDSTHSASWGGVFCGSGALFNAQSFSNSKITNISDPFNCTSSTVTFWNNRALGNTPATAQIFIGQNLAITAFATLGTTAPNGTLIYCSDCTSANPVAGSGTGAVARRENGAWNGGGSGGGAPISGATTNACVSAASATTIQTPSANCLVDPATGGLSAPTGTFSGGILSGTSPPAMTAGTGGAEATNEGTAPSAGPASGVDVCYSDSTLHATLCNNNNQGYIKVAQQTTNTAAFTPGTGVTSATCTSATCTSARGTLSVVGGTGTTGTIVGVAWTATPSAQVCTATMNGGTGFLGIGNSIATTTGFNITAGVTVIGVTFSVNYSCQL